MPVAAVPILVVFVPVLVPRLKTAKPAVDSEEVPPPALLLQVVLAVLVTPHKGVFQLICLHTWVRKSSDYADVGFWKFNLGVTLSVFGRKPLKDRKMHCYGALRSI